MTKKLSIFSEQWMSFADRKDAGKCLGEALSQYKDQNVVVCGIPRGGVVIAAAVAAALNGEMDMILCHKLRAPGNPEVAMGAVTERGKVFLHDRKYFPLSDAAYLEKEKKFQMNLMANRLKSYRKVLPKIPFQDRIVIITDDGVAMGYTMKAALWAAREEKPQKLIAALPVGPEETIRSLSEEADETFCLSVPPYFQAVSQAYADFPSIEDPEIEDLLKTEKLRRDQKSTLKGR